MAKPFHIPPATVNAFQRDLCHWYRRHKRDLPWRRTRDPYAIWISEIMLQQTRVEAVIPYYERWLKAFPTVQSLATAPLHRVLKLWEGLGYYSRARNLHRASAIVAGKGFGDLQQLPGVGPYTAGAIASIAFDQRAPIVDGNVARVFARVFNIRANVKRPATQRQLWSLAETLLPARKCGEFNQALMELGALVCRPVNPRCDACPLRPACSAPGDALPNRGRRPRRHTEVQDVAWDCRQGRVRVRQRPPTGLLAGLWELPPTVAGKDCLAVVRHTIMNRRITLRVWAAQARGGRWVTRRALAHLPMPAAHRRAVNAIAALGTGRAAAVG
jgi:A/G-specific adenine glycosylase